jgi:iron complex transport system ATP-binding protein
MLKIDNISFKYRKSNKYILNDLSLELDQGKIGIILGKNGSGKTTLIKNILGIEKPEKGKIFFDNKDYTRLSRYEKAQYVAYVPQIIDFGALSVFDTVMTGRIPYFGFRSCDDDTRIVNDILKKLGISSFADRSVDELSGGERQKVAIARALAQSPRLMVFDEPTASLDIGNEQIIIKEILNLSRNMNVSILMSIHDINQALLIGDVFYLMKDGTVRYRATKNEITEEMLEDIYDAKIRILDINNERFFVGGIL